MKVGGRKKHVQDHTMKLQHYCQSCNIAASYLKMACLLPMFSRLNFSLNRHFINASRCAGISLILSKQFSPNDQLRHHWLVLNSYPPHDLKNLVGFIAYSFSRLLPLRFHVTSAQFSRLYRHSNNKMSVWAPLRRETKVFNFGAVLQVSFARVCFAALFILMKFRD